MAQSDEGATPQYAFDGIKIPGETGRLTSGLGGGASAGGLSAFRDAKVGYQPVVSSVSYGALLEVTPTLVPQSRNVVLDLKNIVTLPANQPSPPVDYGAAMPLDRLNLVSQQFMTTLRMPLGEPTLVGGLTVRPLSDDSSQLYLVLEVTSAEEQ